MKAGEMRHLVTIRGVVRTNDGGGGATTATEDLAEIWAKKEGLTGAEQFTAMQTGMKRPHRFTIWYRDGITGATELYTDGSTFDVRSVSDPDGSRRELVILADEIP